MKNKINQLIKSLLSIALTGLMVSSGSVLFAQNYEWELDKTKKREQAKKQELDSLMVHYKNNWQVSLSYGQHYFNNSARLKEKSILDFPANIGVWNLSAARYVSEQVSVNVNLGILIKKIIPPDPDVISILGGAEVEIEGGGIILMPLSVGMDYFFMKQRFRPYAGIGLGIVPARYKYIEASGNISNGIDRDELQFSGKAPFLEISSGFLYRMGKNVQLGLNADYLQSQDFNEILAVYKAYNGVKVSLVFSLLLP